MDREGLSIVEHYTNHLTVWSTDLVVTPPLDVHVEFPRGKLLLIVDTLQRLLVWLPISGVHRDMTALR
jgi:hypothetical protein